MANQIQRPQRRTLFLVYTGLIALLILTAVGAYVPMGGMAHVLLAFGVSVAKTALIAFFFMEIHYHNGITRIFARRAGMASPAFLADFFGLPHTPLAVLTQSVIRKSLCQDLCAGSKPHERYLSMTLIASFAVGWLALTDLSGDYGRRLNGLDEKSSQR